MASLVGFIMIPSQNRLPTRTCFDHRWFYGSHLHWDVNHLGKGGSSTRNMFSLSPSVEVSPTLWVQPPSLISKSDCKSPTLWLCQNSYWKWPFILDFPIKNGGSFHSYVSSPEGKSWRNQQYFHDKIPPKVLRPDLLPRRPLDFGQGQFSLPAACHESW